MARLSGPNYRTHPGATLIGPVVGPPIQVANLTTLLISDGPLLRVGVLSTGSLSIGRMGLSTTIVAGGVSIQEATDGGCNRNSREFEGALMMEREGAIPSLAYSNNDTNEDPSTWSLVGEVAGVLDRGNGLLHGTGDGSRTSARLASREKTSILSKAISRKARLRGGGSVLVDESPSTKIIRKNRQCGVILDGTVAIQLAEFVKECV